jgi:microcystin degradation protein MlrC
MKIFTAALLTETCDLNPIPTQAKDWKVERCTQPDDSPTMHAGVLTLFRQLIESRGWAVSESICATAFPPGGRTVQFVYENLRSTIIDDLRQAMPVDGILLKLHGAAMAQGYDDCEGDLLEHIRREVGSTIPIGVELDPHCHLTEKMLSHSTAIILYKTWLHHDQEERAEELFNLIADTLEHKVKPCMAVFDCQMIDFFNEEHEPMKSFLSTVYAKEKDQGVLSISPVHGFPFADVESMGSKMLVITDDNPLLAKSMARELGQEFYKARGQMSAYGGIDAALEQAKARAEKGERSIPLLEFGDCPGCGFATDGTELLQAMLENDMTSVAAGLFWDPLAVDICHALGAGAQLLLRIGGKASPRSGTPLDLPVTVERVDQNVHINTWSGKVGLGDIAVVSSGDMHLILVSERALCGGVEAFKQFGIDPQSKQYLLFKYSNESAQMIVYGSNFDYQTWSFSNIAHPKWPWENPRSQAHIDTSKES